MFQEEARRELKEGFVQVRSGSQLSSQWHGSCNAFLTYYIYPQAHLSTSSDLRHKGLRFSSNLWEISFLVGIYFPFKEGKCCVEQIENLRVHPVVLGSLVHLELIFDGLSSEFWLFFVRLPTNEVIKNSSSIISMVPANVKILMRSWTLLTTAMTAHPMRQYRRA